MHWAGEVRRRPVLNLVGKAVTLVPCWPVLRWVWHRSLPSRRPPSASVLLPSAVIAQIAGGAFLAVIWLFAYVFVRLAAIVITLIAEACDAYRDVRGGQGWGGWAAGKSARPHDRAPA